MMFVNMKINYKMKRENQKKFVNDECDDSNRIGWPKKKKALIVFHHRMTCDAYILCFKSIELIDLCAVDIWKNNKKNFK